MKFLKYPLLLLFALLLTQCGTDEGTTTDATSTEPATETVEKKKFTMVWSIYAGWMPWDYAEHSGILKKWADKYNIEIELTRMDYIASIEAYIAEQADACVMTNMEALDMPAASGITSTAVVVGDYSNGNDAILTRDGLQVKDLKGKDVFLVELSVSHYLLSRALEANGLTEQDVNIINTSDSDIAPAFIANKDQKVVVTWNPLVMTLEQEDDINNIYSSADIPEEVLDMLVVNTKTLKESPEFGKALVGAWFEVMTLMQSGTPEATEALKYMAESSGSTLEEYQAQLNTTAMFYQPQASVDYVTSPRIVEKMDYVRNFCFEHGLLGENAASVDEVGIQYPDGTVQGNKDNVQLIFDTELMGQAVKNEL